MKAVSPELAALHFGRLISLDATPVHGLLKWHETHALADLLGVSVPPLDFPALIEDVRAGTRPDPVEQDIVRFLDRRERPAPAKAPITTLPWPALTAFWTDFDADTESPLVRALTRLDRRISREFTPGTPPLLACALARLSSDLGWKTMRLADSGLRRKINVAWANLAARLAYRTTVQLLGRRQAHLARLADMTPARRHARPLYDLLCEQPVIDVPAIARQLDLARTGSTVNLVNSFLECKILTENRENPGYRAFYVADFILLPDLSEDLAISQVS